MCLSEIWREAVDKVSLTQGKGLLWGYVKKACILLRSLNARYFSII
jgi:hypothetical protein